MGISKTLRNPRMGCCSFYDSPKDNYFGMSDGVLQVSQLADYFGKLTDQGVEVVYIIDACHSGKLKRWR
ncbi:MAG: hypothetical protein IPM92_17170 [Saprospiraceae bacterium]|nr:hypothetical protein [Saprospiraceae bacterium]